MRTIVWHYTRPANQRGEGPHPVASPPCTLTSFPAENNDSNQTSKTEPSRLPNFLLAISSMSSVFKPYIQNLLQRLSSTLEAKLPT